MSDGLDENVFTLHAGDTTVALAQRGPGLPSILHWGASLEAEGLEGSLWDPAVPNSTFDVPTYATLSPTAADGYSGRPGLIGFRPDGGWSPAFETGSVTSLSSDEEVDESVGLRVEAADPVLGIGLTVELLVHTSGILRLRHTVVNERSGPFYVQQLLPVLPLPPEAAEVLDLTGRWCRERHPQRRSLQHGTWARESRHGRSGHDAPLVTAVGTHGFGFRSGEVWAFHLGWSGNHETIVEQRADGRGIVGAGELLLPGEIALGEGSSYTSPWLYAAYSSGGLDGISAKFHEYLRARPSHPRRPRPVTLNTWEAVYFEHDQQELTALADLAADLGMERFVLDDGWFRHRRDDSSGLGDWYVDLDVWPDGLGPLIGHVRELGMEFGLWVEPEMVNPDSDLYRAHPEWVLRPDDERLPLPWRKQQVLDLTNTGAYRYVYERLDRLLGDHDIAYLKWDHNRDVVDAGHGGRPAVHGQTLAVYRLLDELRTAHPTVEIESCSSGGGRVDLGMLQRTDRVWASDSNDALERQHIQRWTGLLLPPELVGAHVGPPKSHTSGRTHHLGFRIATALFGHFGFEWDIREASEADRRVIAAAVSYYKEHRSLLHGGVTVRSDHPDPALGVQGVIASDGSRAIFAITALRTTVDEMPGHVRLPGLPEDRGYRVTAVDFGLPPTGIFAHRPRWMDVEDATFPAGTLTRVGLVAPIMNPEQTLLLECTAVTEG